MRPPPVGSLAALLPSRPDAVTPLHSAFGTDLLQTLARRRHEPRVRSVVDPGVAGRVPLRYRHARRALHHLLQRHALPGRRAGRRSRCSSGSGSRSTSRPSRRAAARCTATRATSSRPRRSRAGSCARSATRRRSSRPSASCAGMVREAYPRLAALAGDEDLARAAADVVPRVYELTEFLVDVLGRRGRRRLVPAPGDATTRRATRCARSTSATGRCGCCGRCAGSTSSSSRRRERVLRVRRHVRGQERRHVDGDALRQAAPRPRHAGGGLRVGGHVVPDAHRRRAAPAARRRAHDAPRRDPGGPGMSAPGVARPFPEAAREALRDSQLRRNIGKATTTIRAKRAAAVAELPDWEALREAGVGDQGAHDGDAARAARAPRGVGHARGRDRALGARRRRGERDRRRDRAGQRRATRSSRSSRWRPTRSASTRRSSARASTRSRPTSPS